LFDVDDSLEVGASEAEAEGGALADWLVVLADSEGDALPAIVKVKVPATGWPSSATTRHDTVYVPLLAAAGHVAVTVSSFTTGAPRATFSPVSEVADTKSPLDSGTSSKINVMAAGGLAIVEFATGSVDFSSS